MSPPLKIFDPFDQSSGSTLIMVSMMVNPEFIEGLISLEKSLCNVKVKLGIDKLMADKASLIKGCRVGLLAHQASVDSKGRNTIAHLKDDTQINLTALFGPEHSITTEAQDMESVPDGEFKDPKRKKTIPIFSLYGSTLESLKPTKEMLSEIDVMVVDLQDIGSRYYTYIWTMALCLKACGKNNKKVIICDRPNPINGVDVEGLPQENGFESFVGLYPFPIRHAMTIGEVAAHLIKKYKIKGDFEIISMEGWEKNMFWGDTGLNWINPSPNMCSFNAALLYPGMCLVEGTNLSEGRGTDTPFEIVGAPFIDADELINEMEKINLPGIKCAPTSFIPVKQKWIGQTCFGIRWMITDEKIFKPYLTGLVFIWLVNKLYKKKGFEWRLKPYEFVTDKPAIDLLTGSSFFRENIDGRFEQFERLCITPQEFLEERSLALLY